MKFPMKYPTKTIKGILPKLLLGVLLLLFLDCNLPAQLPRRPEPPRLVNDLAGILTAAQVDQLETMLVHYNDTTSTQIVVITVKDLQGYEISKYATEIGQAWGVGQSDKDNGVVILVKPKTSSTQGQVNISVGYGLEQYITDATAKRIIDKEMIPSFKEGHYFTGIRKASQVIMDLCSGNFTAKDYTKGDRKQLYFYGIFLILIVVVCILDKVKGFSSSGTSSSWKPASRGYRTGGFGGGHSGGGFSGFGGGHFGGGGASGSW